MLTDDQLTNIAACIDFTRRNAPLTGDQFALVGDAMNAVQAEITERKKFQEIPAKKPKRK